jgi:hypothetical protein
MYSGFCIDTNETSRGAHDSDQEMDAGTMLRSDSEYFSKQYRDDGSAIGVRIPCFFIDLKGALGCKNSDPAGHLAGKMIYLQRVLALAILGMLHGLVFEHFDTLTASCHVFAGHSH